MLTSMGILLLLLPLLLLPLLLLPLLLLQPPLASLGRYANDVVTVLRLSSISYSPLCFCCPPPFFKNLLEARCYHPPHSPFRPALPS